MMDPASLSSDAQKLHGAIAARSAVVGVIGLGYVGLPLCDAFVSAGFPVVGFDTDHDKIAALQAGQDYLSHLGEGFAGRLRNSGRFRAAAATSDELTAADVLLICVPTPLGRHQDPDLQFVEATADAIAAKLPAGRLIVLESTTYPGTTREHLLPRMEGAGHGLGQSVFLAYSPEREDPGRRDLTTRRIPKLVGGLDPVSGELATALYQAAFEQVIPVARAEVAEAAKLLENIYRAVNIALVNEMKLVLSAMGVDIWQVIEAAATKPFGFQRFDPGPGLGGHCIPIDPFYLTWKARELGQRSRFIELAGEVNRFMPEHVIQRLMLALNEHGKAVRGSRVLVLGLAYKPNVGDTRESPSFELLQRLMDLGAEAGYHDPHIAESGPKRDYDFSLESVPLTADELRRADAVLIATHHDAYDWSFIGQHAKLIVDTRGVMRHVPNVAAHVVNA